MRTFAHRPGPGPSQQANPVFRVLRMIGNEAVQRRSDGKQDPTTTGIARFSHDFSHIPTHTAAPVGHQGKLTVSTPGDIHEQQADRVADMVMRLPGQRRAEPLPAFQERQEKSAGRKKIDDEDEPLKKITAAEKCDCAEGGKRIDPKARLARSPAPGADGAALAPAIGARIEAMRGDGRPLSSSERAFMEPRFGADFSAIRIHTGQQADTHSRALHARAFTVGGDIFFRSGEYASGQSEGNHLLAHELTHTIQQGAAAPLEGERLAARRTVSHLVQRQADAGVPVAPLVSRATVNFLPVIMDQVPGADWGVTVEDDAVIDITAFASGGAWKCAITSADQQARQGVHLLPGVVEVTPALVAGEASCPTLQTMITSLDTVASQGGHSGFYMLSAVQAHENLHITQYRTDLAPHYATLKTALAALSVPLAGNADAAAARAAIKALPAYTAAIATFHAGDVAANNKTAAHTLAASFNVVEHAVVDPMIRTIKARRTTLKCPP